MDDSDSADLAGPADVADVADPADFTATATAAQRAALMAEIDAGYERLRAYLDTLDEGAWTGPVDDAGWTVTDHVMHLAVWAESMVAVMDGRPRWEAMGLSPDVWATIAQGYDVINEAIRQQHASAGAAAVRDALERSHRALVARADALDAADLMRPYNYFQPWAEGRDQPLVGYLRGNTVEHYDAHRRYIEAIVGANERP